MKQDKKQNKKQKKTTQHRYGLWLIGAGGGIGGTVALGLAALSKKLADTTGLVTGLPEFENLGLTDPENIVVGGHEIRKEGFHESIQGMHLESGVIGANVIDACKTTLRSWQRNVRPGVVLGGRNHIHKLADQGNVKRVSTGQEAVNVIAEDLSAFRKKYKLTHVIVINIASSEPPLTPRAEHATYAKLWKALGTKSDKILPTSSLYALGAFAADCSYINFTPSVGMRVKAIEEYAKTRDVLYIGRDGKTGETLLKSVLAPLFAMRHLKILSWIGHNVLGNRDGEILSNPAVKVSKIKSKEQLVSRIVGYQPVTRTSIEYIPSLADWKVAWDYVHFEGFLGTKMNLQFTWTGTDSILAAPLVIDLARLTALEHTSGRRGAMPHLSCFFKDPYNVDEHNFFEQWRLLIDYVTCGIGTDQEPGSTDEA